MLFILNGSKQIIRKLGFLLLLHPFGMLLKTLLTPLPGLLLLEAPIQRDPRGSFTKVFHAEAFKAAGLRTDFKESYYSTSATGVLRGMHFQLPPHAHAKLVYVTAGRVLDVALDLRRGPSYGKYFSTELTTEQGQMLYMPEGFAHGFYVAEGPATMVYLVTSEYAPASDAGVRWDSFGFTWPAATPGMSVRDAALPVLQDFGSAFIL